MEDYWEKRYRSAMEGIVSLQGKLAEVTQTNMMLVMEKKQWEIDKVTQGLIISQAVASANAISQLQGAEIQTLKEELRKLKGE